MKETIISVTEAARNFADCVNRAHYKNVTFVLLKNGSPVARLVPEHGKLCPGKNLADALKNTELPEDEVHAWRRELKSGRKTLKAPSSRWR